MDANEINACSRRILDAALRVHSLVGPGLLEAAYEACLAHELRKRGLRTETQVPLPIEYDGTRIELAYRADVIVEECVLVELKTVRKVMPVHEAQLLSYLKLSGFRLGLLINLHSLHLRDGLSRMVNNL
jgi:GxxExxY protein